MRTDPEHPDGLSRRDFVKKTAVGASGLSALMSSGHFAHAAGSDRLRVGVIGCGGRGTGAARDCVTAAEGVEITAMGELFQDRLDQSKQVLNEAVGDKLNVTERTSFVGFDAYQRVLESDIDLAIIASPPGFHPMHLRAAVDAGKHVFLEKPAAVDPPGIKSVMEADRRAHEKGLSVVAGTIYRRQPSFVQAIERIHDGMIGTITGAQAYFLTSPIWVREREPGMSDMEWQCRNWYYFTWLSGDHIVEQFVHNLDVIHWVFQELPEKALGLGGRLVRVDPSQGHIYDHFSAEFEYPSGARLEAKCRQMEGTTGRVTNYIVGTKGVAELHPNGATITSHRGEVLFEKEKGRGFNPYVKEHADLIRSIREEEPVNEAEQLAGSTLMAVMGRESAYTGQALTRKRVMESQLDLMPDTFRFGPMPMPPVPAPGRTVLDRTLTKRSAASKTAGASG